MTAAKSNPDTVIPLQCRLRHQQKRDSDGNIQRNRHDSANQQSEKSLSTAVDAGIPRIYGHSFASTDPAQSAAFAVRYLGATIVHDSNDSW